MNRDQWLKDRKNYLGGSDIAALLGLSPYNIALDVFFDKTSDVVEDRGNKFTDFGIRAEPLIAEWYSRVKGVSLEIHDTPIYHKEHPFLAANIDRWVNNKEYILECKSASKYKRKEWGEEGTDQIPDHYLCQVAWYALICNVDKVDIAVYFRDFDSDEIDVNDDNSAIYTYHKNPEFEKKLVEIAHDFWINNVLTEIPPTYDGTKKYISSMYPSSNGKGKTVNADIKRKIESLKSLKEDGKKLEETIDKLKLDIKEYMQDYDILVNEDGEVMASWKNTSPRSYFDLNKLKEECQDIYLKYTNEAKQSRIFLIK